MNPSISETRALNAYGKAGPNRLELHGSRTFLFLLPGQPMPITRKPHPDSPEDVLAECHRLREENRRLRELLAQYRIEVPNTTSGTSKQTAGEHQALPSPVSQESPAKEKIALFLNLFRGRKDVYAKRWESKDGRSGYSPACVRDWDAIRASKPAERKKIEHKTRTLLPLTDEVIRDHLAGKHTVGVYPLLTETPLVSGSGFERSCGKRTQRYSLPSAGRPLCLPRWNDPDRGKAGTSGFFSNSPFRRPWHETWVLPY